MTYFFDTYAIIEIFKKSKNYERYTQEEIQTSVLNIGELYFYLLREKGELEADRWRNLLTPSAFLIEINDIVKAMNFKLENKNKNLSFVDCVSYTIAKENGLIFLTGDKEFENMGNVEFVK